MWRSLGGRVFRIGDKVTQIRNNYDKGTAGVFNGTVGIVTVRTVSAGRRHTALGHRLASG